MVGSDCFGCLYSGGRVGAPKISTVDAAARVHDSADIEADVRIGPGTSVWQRAQIRSGANIGRDCIVGRDAFIDTGVEIGDRVKIQNGALIYHGVTVGNGVFIGPGAILTNDRYPRAETADGALARAADWVVTPTRVHDGSSIGAGVIVVAGSDIGRYALVGAGSVVTKTVADHALVVGNPARVLGWVCRCGERLRTPRGDPASPGREVDTAGGERTCPRCGRRFVARPGGLELIE